MQRFYQQDEHGFTDHLELNRQTAFHEAGHVAAIYLENKRKSLPPVYFQIDVSKPDSRAQPLLAKVNGGRRVGDLATVIRENVSPIIGIRRIWIAIHGFMKPILSVF